MNNKRLIINDEINFKDNANFNNHGIVKGTEVIIKDPITGKVIHKGHNKTTIAGSLFAAYKLFPFESTAISLPNYNDRLGLDNIQTTNQTNEKELIYLFAVGTGGCGANATDVYDVNELSWIKPENIIPFRHRLVTATDLSSSERELYFGRKSGSVYRSYYFKKIESYSQSCKFVNGNDINSSIYDSNYSIGAVTKVSSILRITRDDFREYLSSSANTDNPNYYINSISLLRAWQYTDPSTGYIYYQDIQPVSKYNFPNRTLLEDTTAFEIEYNNFF